MDDSKATEAARLLAGLRQVQPRVCEVCGTEVVATARRRYCTPQCRLKADYLRHAEARKQRRRERYQQQKKQPPNGA